MKRLIVVVLLGFLAWQGYAKYQSSLASSAAREDAADLTQPSASLIPKSAGAPSGQFQLAA
jgi:predicted negative regulator of RcsB-dependent stress response